MNRHGNEGAGKERRRAVPVEEGGRGGYHSGGGALGRWGQCDDVNLRRRTPLKKNAKKSENERNTQIYMGTYLSSTGQQKKIKVEENSCF